jgi:hypothetical protein
LSAWTQVGMPKSAKTKLIAGRKSEGLGATAVDTAASSCEAALDLPGTGRLRRTVFHLLLWVTACDLTRAIITPCTLIRQPPQPRIRNTRLEVRPGRRFEIVQSARIL